MTNEQLVELLIDIDLEYWNNVNPMNDPVTRHDLKVAISKYQYVAEKIREVLDSEYQKGYDTCLRNMHWTDKDHSIWK